MRLDIQNNACMWGDPLCWNLTLGIVVSVSFVSTVTVKRVVDPKEENKLLKMSEIWLQSFIVGTLLFGWMIGEISFGMLSFAIN